MYSLYVTGALPPVGFPIRKSPGQSLFSGSPRLIAAYRVLHRLPLPRHPPYALSSLTIKKTVNQSILPVRTLSFDIVPTTNLYAIVKELRTTNLGGGERVRTDDPLRARQVLSQLSYTPKNLVGLDGLEPSTSRLSVVCSSQLSYRPLKAVRSSLF
jgi:hypothetical protein